MPKGTLITQLPCVSWLIGCAILGISEILAARRGYAQGSISTLIWPTATGGFLSLVSLLAIWMLGRFRSVEIQARAVTVSPVTPARCQSVPLAIQNKSMRSRTPSVVVSVVGRLA